MTKYVLFLTCYKLFFTFLTIWEKDWQGKLFSFCTGKQDKEEQIQCLKQVLSSERGTSKLSRYRYHKLYTYATLASCYQLIPGVWPTKTDFNKISIYYYGASTDDLEDYNKHIPESEKVECSLRSVRNDVEGTDGAHPVVLIIPKEHKSTIFRYFESLTANFIVLFLAAVFLVATT